MKNIVGWSFVVTRDDWIALVQRTDAIEAQQNTNTAAIVAAAKGWCKFASDGTIATGSFNVTSASKDSTGVYTITWGIDFANANYVPVATSLTASFIAVVTDIAAGTCKVRTYSISSGVFIANDAAAGITAFGAQ